jgi:4-hydroxy-3-methylbut-2-enyl diphosphate reductase
MEVIRADVLGYCAGVKRAIDIALKEAVSGAVLTVGPLIHNKSVLEDLKKCGIESFDEKLTEIPVDRTIVIRSHGITLQLEEELRKCGAKISDATCPKVKKNQLQAKELSQAGYRVFLAGEKQHDEIAGIMGYAPCIVVEKNSKAAEELFYKEPNAKTALIGQTTISPDEYQAIALEISSFFPDVKVIDTICSATKDRQDALKRLCGKVDAVIVAGGKESANTQRLFTIARASGKPVFFVESASELPKEVYSYAVVGISAGASTPNSTLDDIEGTLKATFKQRS